MAESNLLKRTIRKCFSFKCFPISEKRITLYEVSQSSPACPSNKSSVMMKVTMEYWQSLSDIGKWKYSEETEYFHSPLPFLLGGNSRIVKGQSNPFIKIPVCATSRLYRQILCGTNIFFTVNHNVINLR
jgi:hypothetical protein